MKIISSMLSLAPVVLCAGLSLSLSAQSISPTSKATQTTRSIYLNGVDISNARQQELRNVHVQIDTDGNVFLKAPHYQVTEEETFIPLSSGKSYPHSPTHGALMEKSASAASLPTNDAPSSSATNPSVETSSPPARTPAKNPPQEVINKPVVSGQAQPSQPATLQSPRL